MNANAQNAAGNVLPQKGVEHEYPWLIRYPLKLLLGLVSTAFSFLRPLAPQLIPLAFFALTVPILVFLSFSAGWIVWRSIAVGWETSLFLQYGDGVPPYARISLPHIVAQQPYDVSLQLTVPTTEANVALGNFMTSLTLLTPANRTIVSIRRPAIVLPPTMSPLSSVYRRTATTNLKIPLLTSFEADTGNVIAEVELGRKDQWRSIGKGEGRELSVLSAVLRGVVVHKGVRGLVTRFPLLTAATAAGSFLVISFIVLASCLLPAIEWRFLRETPESEVQEKPRRRPREEQTPRKVRPQRRSKSVATPRRSSYTEFQTEENTSIIPPTDVATSPLRRRRSRLSQFSEADR